MTTEEARAEIIAAIEFYEARGWNWLDVVAFTACEALGILPQDVRAQSWRRMQR